jgi:drug/metabolite transporter (DMT)-like permease
MVGAAFFFSLMSAFVKSLGGALPSQEIVLVRSALTLGYAYALVRYAGKALWGTNRRLLVLRGLFGLGGVSCFFWALTALPLADATVLHYTNPVITALLAALVLGESLGRAEIGGALLSLAGVVLIAQPSFLFGAVGAAGLELAYVGVALGGAFFSSCAYVTVRKLRATEDPMVIVFYYPLIATLGSIPLTTTTDPAWPTLWQWGVLALGVAGTGTVAQVLLTRGLHAQRAGRAMAVSYLQIVFAAVWGALFFDEVPDLLSIAGAALVIGGTVLVAQAESSAESQEE